jgi:hypothetical protein
MAGSVQHEVGQRLVRIALENLDDLGPGLIEPAFVQRLLDLGDVSFHELALLAVVRRRLLRALDLELERRDVLALGAEEPGGVPELAGGREASGRERGLRLPEVLPDQLLRFDPVLQLRDPPLDPVAVGRQLDRFFERVQCALQVAVRFLLASPGDQLVHRLAGDLVEVLVLRRVRGRPPRLKLAMLLAQGVRHLARGLRALRHVLFEELEDQRVDGGGDRGVLLPRRFGLAIEDVVRDQRLARRIERVDAREQLVQDDAEREEIAAMIDGIVAELLGRAVGLRPRLRPVACHLRVFDVDDPEVHELDLLGAAALHDHHVGRLDVPVDDVVPVRELQGFGQLPCDLDAALEMPGALLLDERREVGPVEKLHDEIEAAVDLAVVVDLDDVGMVEERGVLDLVLEPRARVLVAGVLLREELHGHDAVEHLRVGGLVHLAHGAGSQELDESVGADRVHGH